MWTKEKTVQKQYSSISCRSRERRKRIVKQQLAMTKKKTLVRVNLTKFWPCPPNKVNVCLSVCLRDLCLSFLFYMWACDEGSERVGGNVGTEGQKSSEWTIPFSFGKERRERDEWNNHLLPYMLRRDQPSFTLLPRNRVQKLQLEMNSPRLAVQTYDKPNAAKQ